MREYKMFVTKIETNRGIVCTGSRYLDYYFSRSNGSYARPIVSYHPIEFWKGKFLKVERI